MDRLQENAEFNAILLPLSLYDHSGLAMNTIGFHCPRDSGQVGFIYVTLKTVREEVGTKRVTKALREKAEDILRGEFVSYDAYLGGWVFGYVIERGGGEVDACLEDGDYEAGCLPKARAVVDKLLLREAHILAAAEQGASPAPGLKCLKYAYILFMRTWEVSMASTSVTLGPHWDEFIALMLKEGRYGSTSELIRASLRLMEEQEGHRARLRVALMEGKRSGDAGPLDMDAIKREARGRSGASDA